MVSLPPPPPTVSSAEPVTITSSPDVPTTTPLPVIVGDAQASNAVVGGAVAIAELVPKTNADMTVAARISFLTKPSLEDMSAFAACQIGLERKVLLRNLYHRRG